MAKIKAELETRLGFTLKSIGAKLVQMPKGTFRAYILIVPFVVSTTEYDALANVCRTWKLQPADWIAGRRVYLIYG